MPRKGEVKRRDVLSDPKYGDRMVTKFMSSMMRAGKRGITEGIVYGALDIVADRAKEDALAVIKRALEAAKPVVEVRSRRVGGATYQVPVEVPARRARTLAVRWLVSFARGRREKSMADRLANEILDSTQQQGGAWKRKDDIYRMAQANKAFAHYRW
jgi:small subunit ribosomal protein S7